MERYEPAKIESKWQRVWADEGAFRVPNPEPGSEGEQKTYVLEMLPYPSGELHVGHVRNYMLGEVVSHFRRRRGEAVLRPMGFDSFGLPTENAAIQAGRPPAEISEENIASLSQLGKHIQTQSPRGPVRTPRSPSASSAYSRSTCGRAGASSRGGVRSTPPRPYHRGEGAKLGDRCPCLSPPRRG